MRRQKNESWLEYKAKIEKKKTLLGNERGQWTEEEPQSWQT